MHANLNIAVKAARAASEMILQAIDRMDTIEVIEKSTNDFVTGVDKASEQIIMDIVKKAYPDHGFLCEESGSSGECETRWIIDPLDGTTNFIHGFPHFSISIAVEVKGRIEHGVIYDPIRHDLFTASRGGGTYLNSHRVRVANKTHLQGTLLGTGFPYKNKERLHKYFDDFEHLFTQAAGIRRTGSVALDLAYVACGRLDGFWEHDLNIWDIAAGALMVKEAGGIVGDLKGGETHLKTGNILAANPKLFKAMLKSL